MFKLILISALVTTSLSKPTDNPTANDQTYRTDMEAAATEPDITIVKLNKDMAVLTYIETFKKIMTAYVRTEYNNLTFNEVDKIRSILDDFLTNFAKDLRAIVNDENQDGGVSEFDVADDVMPDSTFADIRQRMREAFPELPEWKLKEITYRLRRNLMSTRQKIAGVVRKSKLDQIENSM